MVEELFQSGSQACHHSPTSNSLSWTLSSSHAAFASSYSLYGLRTTHPPPPTIHITRHSTTSLLLPNLSPLPLAPLPFPFPLLPLPFPLSPIPSTSLPREPKRAFPTHEQTRRTRRLTWEIDRQTTQTAHIQRPCPISSTPSARVNIDDASAGFAFGSAIPRPIKQRRHIHHRAIHCGTRPQRGRHRRRRRVILHTVQHLNRA